MNTKHRRITAVLYNGHEVAIHHRVVVNGWVRGLTTFDGHFIHISNVAYLTN